MNKIVTALLLSFPLLASAQTAAINGGGTVGVVYSAGTYNLPVLSLNTATSAPGGCNWTVTP